MYYRKVYKHIWPKTLFKERKCPPTGQQINNGHRQKHKVGRRPEMLLRQHNDNERVGQRGDHDEDRHHKTVERKRVILGQKRSII